MALMTSWNMGGQSSTEETIKGLLSLVALCVIGYFAWQFYFEDKLNPTAANNPTTAAEQQSNPVVRQQLSVQEEFETKRAEFSKAYESADNDIKKSAIYPEVNAWTKEFCSSRGAIFTNWIGKLFRADTDKGGENLSLTVESYSHEVRLAYLGDKVRRGSTVYEQATPLKAAMFKGDVVYFSFEFKRDSEKGYKETSWSESGSVKNPDFDVKINYIGKLPQTAHGITESVTKVQFVTTPSNMTPDEKKAHDAIEEALK